MEIKNDLHKYIVVFDNILHESTLRNFTKWVRTLKFEKAKVIGDKEEVVEEKIRKTLSITMASLNEPSMTKVHWTNYLMFHFNNYVKGYDKLFKFNEDYKVNDIQLLKYVKGGHYLFHVDDCATTNRRLSCIYFVNDEYEGGDLHFKYPNSEDVTKIEKKKNRLVVWPSNFLYPHSVKEVTKGERYSVVAWAQ
tara:strand:- start:1983 stop:2561 length:579 start_codon:yes stop_codon:yes gene_type:complete